MAKLSSINKNKRRKKLVKQYAAKCAALKADGGRQVAAMDERLIARLKLAEIPRNAKPDPRAQPLRHHRPPARLLSQVRLCRIELRDLANKGMIPGVTKSSW